MSKIQIINMGYSYSEFYKSVFENVNLTIDCDWRLGLIGRNGRGKSTLLKLINGDIEIDNGKILKDVSTEIFPYENNNNYSLTLDVIRENIGPYRKIFNEMEGLISEESEESLEKYMELLSEYIELDGYNIDTKIKKEINLMDLSDNILERPFDELSGGEKTKCMIISLFLRDKHFVLMDEPTNHLDQRGIDDLAKYLSKKKGYIIVSHDRNFLDKTVDHILSINKKTIEMVKGNFSTWNRDRILYENYELGKKKRIENSVKALEKSSRQSRVFSNSKELEKKGGLDKGFIGARAARLMKRAKNTERRINKELEEKRNLLKNYENIQDLLIKNSLSGPESILSVKNLSFGFEKRVLFDNISFDINKGDCLRIKGVNGSGKSTLISIILGRIAGYKGAIKIHSDIIVAESYQLPLWQKGRVSEHIKEAKVDQNKFRNILSYFDMYSEYFDRPLETFSSGELKKIDIARALSTENNLLIMDEPLNYMDLFFREQLEKTILKYRPTIIFVEHDEIFASKIMTKSITL